MSEEISVGLLEDRLIGDLQERFFVPDYQRGYRWGEIEVGHLLDDIWASKGEPYYLQPVVVKDMKDGRWELVDGQQRLTTLFLIFQYMHHAGLKSVGPAYSIEYQTRPDSERYLRDIGIDDADVGTTNIDYFHIAAAYSFISAWFEKHEGRRQFAADKVYGYLFESVKVIWYEAPDELNEKSLFTRLNVGRIPLTDAELVKAVVLSKSRGDGRETDRALEVAAQWDSIERDLRNPELWAFLTGDHQSRATHISLLLDTLAGGQTGRGRALFYTFETLRREVETTSALALWNRVIDLHSLVIGWYEDRALFHKIGYLVATGISFSDLVARADRETKSGFEDSLDGLIRKRLDLRAAGLSELGYEQGYDKCIQVLLLMNVETVRQAKHSSERYSFEAHAARSWSLEHIHAQQSKSLDTVDQWTTWLQLHREALIDFSDADAADRDALIGRIDATLADLSNATFQQLQVDVAGFFTLAGDPDDAQVDSIANLALLEGDDNSALNNSVFEVKRRAILQRDREGSYIPVCTRNVFLKYYTRSTDQHIHFWGRADRDAYLAAMHEILAPYFRPEEITA